MRQRGTGRAPAFLRVGGRCSNVAQPVPWASNVAQPAPWAKQPAEMPPRLEAREEIEQLVTDEPSIGFSVAHILVKHAGSARQASWRDPQGLRIPSRTKEEAAATLSELRQQLEQLSGERRAHQFAELAFQTSDCGTAREGGNLGQIDMGELEEEFELAIAELSPWEVSDVVETDSGLHLIMRLPAGYDASPNTTPPEPPNTVSDARDGLTGVAPNSVRRKSGSGPKESSGDHHHSRPPAPKKAEQKYKPTVDKTAGMPKHLAKLKGSALRQQEDDKMRRLFNRADTDGSGSLQLKEVKQLCRELGDRISNSTLEEGFYRMDPERTGAVDFESFKKWWRLKEDTARREMRKNVEHIFTMMDEDGNGTLDRMEIGLVAAKIAKKFSGAEFDPPFSLAVDYPAMDPDGKGYVTKEHFTAWFKVRSGDTEADIPVLPEYMVEKVKTLSDGRGLGNRSGKDLWRYLRLRLGLIVKLQVQWGRVQDLYGTGGGLFDTQTIPDGLYDPDSAFMKYWDTFQFFALTYIILIIPVRVGFAVEVPLLSFPFFVDMIIDIYFIFDIYLNFNTAQWLPSGVLQTNPKKIRRAYCRGWFSIDFISSFPITYILLISRLAAGDTRGERNGYQRLLRLSKIIRFKRLRAVLKKYEDNGVIGDVTPYLGSIGTLGTIVISGHFLSCLWFYCGNAYGTIDCDPTHEYADILGRIGDTECVEKPGGGYHFPVSGWVIRQDYPEATTLGTKYIDSVYSVFKSKFAYTGNEMKVGIMSELVLGLIFGSLAGIISGIMVTLGAGQQDAMAKMLQLRAWMRARDLKTSDRVKILAAFNAQQELSGFDQDQILRELPPSLSADVSFFMYGGHIERIPIFRHLGQEVIAETCRWVRDVTLGREQIVYQEGKYGTEMYFIVRGEVEVSLDGERLGFLSEGAFFGEGPLIESISGNGGNGANIRTRTVRTLCRCDLGVIRLEDVDSIVSRYPELKIRLSNFNLVGKNFSTKGNKKKTLQKLKSVLHTSGDTDADILLPPSIGDTKVVDPLHSPLQMQLDEEKARNAAHKALAEKETAALRAEVEGLRSALAASTPTSPAPPEGPSVTGRTFRVGDSADSDQPMVVGQPRPLRPEEEDILVEVPEGRMAKGVKTAFLPDGRHFSSVDQAAAAVLRAQSQVMKAQTDLLRACAYSPAAADAALKVQSDAALSETVLTSLLDGMNDSPGEASGIESMRAKANLAQVMSNMADPETAQPVFNEVVRAQSMALGEDHLETLQTKRMQAIAMKKAGNHSGAQELLEEVIAGLADQLGPTHLTAVESRCDLASSLRATGQEHKARGLYEESIEAQTAELGPKHATTLTTRFNLASLLDQMNERESARAMYEDIVQAQAETLGADHPETLDTMYNLADLLESRRFKEFSRARELFGVVAAGYKEVHGPAHAETQDAEERLRRANFRLRQKRNAAVSVVAAVTKTQPAPSRPATRE
eukprot:COSAG02_NODE_1909_length_10419_cov_238.761725_7_plen_1462_part_00